jgi:hypothetical protein
VGEVAGGGGGFHRRRRWLPPAAAVASTAAAVGTAKRRSRPPVTRSDPHRTISLAVSLQNVAIVAVARPGIWNRYGHGRNAHVVDAVRT